MKEGPFVMAGIFDAGQLVILTTSANELVEPLHDRMPVILPEEAHRDWLHADTPSDELKHWLRPYPAEEMKAHPVSPKVNKVANDDPSLLVEVREERGLF